MFSETDMMAALVTIFYAIAYTIFVGIVGWATIECLFMLFAGKAMKKFRALRTKDELGQLERDYKSLWEVWSKAETALCKIRDRLVQQGLNYCDLYNNQEFVAATRARNTYLGELNAIRDRVWRLKMRAGLVREEDYRSWQTDQDTVDLCADVACLASNSSPVIEFMPADKVRGR